MSYPFRIGGRYRNRNGEYEVLSIEGRHMTIRFDSGQVLSADIDLMARIWENIQAEASAPPPARERRDDSEVRPRRQTRLRNFSFHGLVDGDFKRSVEDTTWRRRDALGGLLAQKLTDEFGVTFTSTPVYRQSRVYLTYEEFPIGTRESGTRVVKFYFSLDGEGARAGLLIERSDGPMDETWDWPRWVRRLEAGVTREEAMRDLGITAELWLTPKGGKGVRAGWLGWKEGQLLWRGADARVPDPMSWPQFAKFLDSIDPEVWSDLYLFSDIEKEEAIRLGAGVADWAIGVYRSLYPMYRMALR